MANPPAEFRGVWIATVDNIDWPLPKQYNAEDQKREFIRQLDLHQRNGMNAVIVQVRPASDAFYPSQYEPWSQWLTGKQGQPPAPFYDPLQFMIEEAHKRGFEFHAWLNPYRANVSVGKASIAPTHITKLHPEWFVEYGGKLYFDPGNKEGQKWVTDVVRDIVKRYEVDAIHMDDYFYPYRVPGKEFPDWKTYNQYGAGMSKDEWRRSNTDSIIVALNKTIKEEKPWVKFGISPFGVWRNQSQDPMGSATQAGVTNYDDLYADILLWTEMGWIDYVVPQLYWEMGHPKAPYETLIEWWSKNTHGRHLYIGHGVYRAYEPKNWPWHRPDQLPRQLQLLRTYPTVQGSAYFSSKTFNNNPNGWNDSLQNNYYRQRVPVPEMPWLPQNPNSKIVKVAAPVAPATSGPSQPAHGEGKMD
jgi:uncharacterized lipoprotein YddW (UPF0748 family)